VHNGSSFVFDKKVNAFYFFKGDKRRTKKGGGQMCGADISSTTVSRVATLPGAFQMRDKQESFMESH